MGAALALVVAAALGAPSLELQASLRTEVGGRRYDPDPGDAARTDHLLLLPVLQADLLGPDARLAAIYHPRFAITDTAGAVRQQDLLHEGVLRLAVLAARPWHLTLEGGGSLGRTDLVTQNRPGTGGGGEGGSAGGGGAGGGTGGTAPPPVLTTTGTIDYQSAYADLALAGPTGHASTLSVTAGARIEGGATAEARQAMPTQRLARAELLWAHRATRRDTLELRTTALGAELPDVGTRSATGTGVATWHHRFSRTVDGRAGAGAAGGWVELASRTRSDVYPAGELGLAHQAADGRSGQDVLARFGAGIDRLTGEVSKEQELVASARWAVGASVTLTAALRGALAQQVLGDTRRGNLEARCTWAVHRLAEMDLGAYGQAQRSDRPTLPTFVEWGGYLGLTVRSPTTAW